MIEFFSAILGFGAPFLPELLKYFNRKQDNAHELSMMSLQAQLAEKQHAWKMEEIITTADAAETVELHKPMSSFGVQLLDAAKGQGLSGWALYPAFYLFAILDFISGFVRPGITYVAFGFYMSVKWAELIVANAHNSALSALKFIGPLGTKFFVIREVMNEYPTRLPA